MDLSGLISENLIYNLARGPLVWLSISVFVIATALRTLRLVSLLRPNEEVRVVSVPADRETSKRGTFLERSADRLLALRHTILGVSPATVLVSIIFHLCIFVVPLFLLAHNILLKQAIGFSLFSLPEEASNLLTIVFLLCAIFFLLRRIFLQRVRIITTVYDYLVWMVTISPFLTGVLAYHQFYDYRTIIILHMLTGEIMLILIPFTKIFHLSFFFIGRFVIAHEHTIGRGSRSW